MKKIIGLLLALVMVISLFGCTAKPSTTPSESGASDDSSGTSSTDNVVKGSIQDLSFTWYKNYDWYAAEKWAESNESEIWIKDKYGVNVTYVDAGGAAATKLSTMMVDNKYPDVISLERDQNLQALIDAGALAPLDDYIEGSYLQKYLGDDLLNMFRASDGHLYAFPNWAAPVGTDGGNQGWIVQNKWYEKAGKPALKSYDDLYAYLKTVKEKFPNVTPLQIGVNLAGMCVMYGGFNENTNPDYMLNNVYRDGEKLSGILIRKHFFLLTSSTARNLSLRICLQ